MRPLRAERIAGYALLAADALEIADATRNDPVPFEGLREIYLPECEFWGKNNRKIQYAILTSASVQGGLEPDLLGEAAWWRADDYWRYALYAAVALIRAGAERQSVTIAQMVEQLADRAGVYWLDSTRSCCVSPCP
jgi:hypothetical protein